MELPTPQEMAEHRAAKLTMNIEAVRVGLFTSAVDMAEVMKENNVDDADAAIVDGAVMFAVELWDNTMVAVGHSPSKSRKALVANVIKALSKAREKREQQLKEDK